MSPGESRARVCGWVSPAGQVSLPVFVGWGDTAFYATRSSIISKQRLFIERARANGLNIDQRVLSTMDWGSSSDIEDYDEHDDVDAS